MALNKTLRTVFSGGLLLAGMALPAAADTFTVGGGEWEYGITYDGGQQQTVYSYYYHGSELHRASTINGDMEYDCEHTGGGKTARSVQRADQDGTDHAYWSVGDVCS